MMRPDTFARHIGVGPCLAAVVAATLAVPATAQVRIKTEAPTVDYTVQLNDTLYGLASEHLVSPGSWAAVKKLNRVQNPRLLQPESTLHIPVSLLKKSPIGARVLTVTGEVECLRGAQPVAVLRVGQPLTEGDVVQTGPRSFTTVELSDGSHVALLPNTNIEVKRLRSLQLSNSVDRQIQLNRGEVETQVSPLKPQDRFNITTPSIVAGVRGTQYRVTYNKDAGKSVVEVLEGKVGVQGNSTPVIVPRRFGVMATANGQVSEPLELLPPPSLARPERVQNGGNLVFDLNPLPGAQGYRATVATDAGMLNVIDDARSDNTSVTLSDVAPGSYFVRVAAVDPNGIEGLSRIYAFGRTAAAPNDSSSGNRPNIEFRWAADTRVNEPQAYRFVLATNEWLSNPMLDQHELGGTRLELSDLPSGTYYWSVIPEHLPSDAPQGRAPAVLSFSVGQ